MKLHMPLLWKTECSQDRVPGVPGSGCCTLVRGTLKGEGAKKGIPICWDKIRQGYFVTLSSLFLSLLSSRSMRNWSKRVQNDPSHGKCLATFTECLDRSSISRTEKRDSMPTAKLPSAGRRDRVSSSGKGVMTKVGRGKQS